jgi:hypothetical protein
MNNPADAKNHEAGNEQKDKNRTRVFRKELT